MSEVVIENRRPIPAMLVSRPGVLRQSLWAWLVACSWIEVVAVFGDALTTLNQLERFRPHILVIDSNLLDEEVDALIAAVEARFPGIRCLAVTTSGIRMAQLLALGADAVATRDGSAVDLKEKLLALAQNSLE
jgi:DNA-binding NarL/FixJ family response regulator